MPRLAGSFHLNAVGAEIAEVKSAAETRVCQLDGIIGCNGAD